ncbi:MAG: O-antigen ligase family protein [Chromatiales bacterium]|nr:O-antigen ligase family protein [Chromatiales bacterium]
MSLTSAIFLIAFSGGLILSLVRHPAFGLYTYVAIFYLHPPDRWWGEMLPDVRWSLLAAFVTLLSLWRAEAIPGRPGWLHNNSVRLFLLFVVWFWIQLPWALAPEEHMEAGILFTKYLLLVYLIYAVVQTEEIFGNVLLAHVLGCFFLGWIVFVTPESGRLDGRFDGVGGPGIDDANSLAMQLATGLLAASALILRGSMPIRLIALAVTPFIVNGMIQTMSRGPVLGLIFGGLVMLMLTPTRFRRVYYALGVLGLLILLRMAPDTFWERLGTISATVEQPEEVDMSTQTRLALVTAQLQMTFDHPFGSGHRGTAVLSPRYLGAEHMAKTEWGEALGTRSSHNTFLTVLAEQGVIGAMLFAGLLVTAFRQLRGLKALDRTGLPEGLGTYRAAVAGCLACVLMAGMFTDFLKAEVFVWFIGLQAALYDLAARSMTAAEPAAPAAPLPPPAPTKGPRRLAGAPPARGRR